MDSGRQTSKRWFSIVVTCAWIAAAIPAGAQSQSPRKAGPNPPAAQAPEEKPDPLQPLLQQANDAIDKKDFSSAIDPLQKYIAQRPDEAYPHFQLGYTYAGLKRSNDAKEEFSRAIALDPKMGEAHLNLGLVLMDQDPASAADEFRHAAELQPTESRPRFLAGYCFEETGKLPEAVEQYRAALAIAPKDYESHFALGRVLLQSKDLAGAEEQFRQAVAERSDSAQARFNLANTLLSEGKRDQAREALTEFLKLDPRERTAHLDRALAFFELDQFDNAIGEIDQFEAGSEPTPDSLKMRANIYMQQKRWSEAAQALTRANQLSPTDAELAEWMGHVEIELHDYPKAVRILAQVYSQNPKSVGTLRDLANAFVLAEDYGQAIEAMDRLAKLETPAPGSWFVKAICYDKLSRKAEAIEAYQKFLDQDAGQHNNQDFQARHRILVLQKELGQSKK